MTLKSSSRSSERTLYTHRTDRSALTAAAHQLVETHHIFVHSDISLSILWVWMVAEHFRRPVERHASITSIWLKVEDGLDRRKVQFALEADRVDGLCSCSGH